MKVSYNKTKHTYQHTYKNGNKKQKKIHHPAIKTVHGPLFMYKLNTKHTYCHCFVHSVGLVVLHICRLMFNLRLICIFLRTSSFHSLCAFIRGKRRKIPNMHSNLITRVRSQFVLILFLSLPLFLSVSLYRVVSLFRIFIKQPI